MKLKMTLEMDVEETEHGNVGDLLRDLTSYFSDPEAPLLTDYGRKAWGGYDGAWIKRITVEDTRIN